MQRSTAEGCGPAGGGSRGRPQHDWAAAARTVVESQRPARRCSLAVQPAKLLRFSVLVPLRKARHRRVRQHPHRRPWSRLCCSMEMAWEMGSRMLSTAAAGGRRQEARGYNQLTPTVTGCRTLVVSAGSGWRLLARPLAPMVS